MQFAFSSEQEAFARSVRATLDRTSPLNLVRDWPLEEAGARAQIAATRPLADLGLCAAPFPETLGGAGAGVIALAAAAESLGAALSPAPIASSVYGFGLTLQELAQPDDVAAWLPGIMSGDVVGSIYFGPGLRGHAGRISGAANPVLDGLTASVAIVWAGADNGETAAYLIDLRQAGIKRAALHTLDPSKPAAHIWFDNAEATVLSSAQHARLAARDRLAILLAFEQIGGADAALERARLFATDRRAFGRAIGSYQAIKHQMADAWVKIEIARSHAYYAICCLDQNRSDIALAAAAARVSACDAFENAARLCLHVHGAQGFTWDGDPQLYYRRARALSAALGSTMTWREQLARLLMGGARPAL